MKKFTFIVLSYLLVILIGANAWGDTPTKPSTQQHTLFPSRLDASHTLKDEHAQVHLEIDPLGLNTPVNLGSLPENITYDTTFQTRGGHHPLSLLSKQEWRGFWQLNAHFPASHVTITSTGELLSTPLEIETRSGNVASWYFLVRLKHDRPWEKSSYGAEYARIEPDFPYETGSDFTSDQEGLRLWGRWRFGITKLQMSLREFQNNVYNDPYQTRMQTSEGKLVLHIEAPSWPRLSFSYTSRMIKSIYTPDWTEPTKLEQETARATLSYDGASWTTTLTSVYSQTTDQQYPDTQEQTVYYELAVSYNLTHAINVTPTLSLQDWSDRPSQTRLTTPSASLSLTYHRLFTMLDVTAQGSYKHGEDNQGTMDYRRIDTSVSLVWNLARFFHEHATLTFQASYAKYVDDITPASTYDEISGGIFLKIVPL